jgi:hypothetical protein
MLPSSEYRYHAADCVRAAQAAETPASKALYLTMAEIWARLADQAGSLRRRPDLSKVDAKITPNHQPLQSTPTTTTH